MTVKDLLDAVLKQLQDGAVRLDSPVAVCRANAGAPEIPVVAVNGDEDTGVLTVYFATPEEVEVMLEEEDAADLDDDDDGDGFDPEHN